MIHILTPLAPNKKVSEIAEKMLLSQTVQCRRFTHCQPGNFSHRRLHESFNRNVLKNYATNPYTVWMDHDVVLSDPEQLERCIKYLKDHDDLGGVAIDTKGINTKRAEMKGHVVVACVVMRGWIARTLEYRPWTASGEDSDLACNCHAINNDMKYARTDIRMPLAYKHDEKATEIK
jgi:hypothetical protein